MRYVSRALDRELDPIRRRILETPALWHADREQIRPVAQEVMRVLETHPRIARRHLGQHAIAVVRSFID